MKFSVLIPTRNRLELLRFAVESVRRQDVTDWELVIADNDSAEDVEGFVASLRDERIQYLRSHQFISVTENWNRALAASSGDYFVMLGDDDCLLSGYFRRMGELIRAFEFPDVLHVQAIQFAYPGVFPGRERAFIQTGYSELLGLSSTPSRLGRRQALNAVENAMNFRVSFGYNMQHFLISRELLQRTADRGPFFQTPYPDYFAANVALLAAREVVLVPDATVAIGISPKSFGYFYLNEKVDEGIAFLNADRATVEQRRQTLPGNPLLTSWYLAVSRVEELYGRDVDLRANTGRYRMLQVLDADTRLGLRGALGYWPLLTWRERFVMLRLVIWRHAIHRLVPGQFKVRLWQRHTRAWSPWPEFDPQIRDVDFDFHPRSIRGRGPSPHRKQSRAHTGGIR